jgi:sugar-specific transcriptional regulator TrmB
VDNTWINLIQEAGLTEGEAKVYLALLKYGSTTTGPLLEESGVANSVIYRLLDSLIEKGLASYIIKEKTKYFQAADPKKILEYIDEKKNKLEEKKDKISSILPQLSALINFKEDTTVKVYEGFNGIRTAYEQYYTKSKKGDEILTWGIVAVQDEKYHSYWKMDHVRRKKFGITNKLLFNYNTDKETLINRNSYWGCDARYMPNKLITPAWFMVFADVTLIILQQNKAVAVEIENKDITDSFRAYFNDLWAQTVSFKK